MVTVNITKLTKSSIASEGIEEVTIDVESEEDLMEIKRLKESDSIVSVEVEGASISMADSEDEYDEFLDEIYGDFVPENMANADRRMSPLGRGFNEYPRFSASRVLKELDPTFYRIGFNEYQDRIIEDARDELEQYEDEKSQGIVDYIVSWIDY